MKIKGLLRRISGSATFGKAAMAALVGGAALLATPAQAQVSFGLQIGHGHVGVYAPGPAYYAPQPVYAAPVYAAPAYGSYVESRDGERDRGWERDHVVREREHRDFDRRDLEERRRDWR